MAGLRRDAARNRERILSVAREMTGSGEPLQLNAVARRAEVGIGTVYRHFDSPAALTEGLVEHRFTELIDLARQAAREKVDVAGATRTFLSASLRAFAADPAFAEASVTPTPARDETRHLKAELLEALEELVRSAHQVLRPGIDAHDLVALACGVGYSIRIRPDRASQYVDILLDEVMSA